MLTPVSLTPLDRDARVSVLVANYNYARFVGEAIESVLAQTYPHVELVVCDDGSSDDSCAVIQSYVDRDPRVTLVRLPQNQGMAAATNAAFAASSGAVVCLLDADDTFAPTKLERVVAEFYREPRAGLLVHSLTIVDGEGRSVQRIPYLSRFERGWIAQRLVRRGGRWRDMPTSALCFRREVADLAFPIPEEAFRRAADGYLFTLMPLLADVAAIDDPLAWYRVHGANDHAALGLTATSLRSDTRFLELQNTHVNRRLQELGMQATLDLDRHLAYRQKVFTLQALERTPWTRLVSEYRSVCRMLLADDQFRPLQKVLGVGVFGVAVLLPARLRPRWLGVSLGFSRSKQRFKEFLAALGRST